MIDSTIPYRSQVIYSKLRDKLQDLKEGLSIEEFMQFHYQCFTVKSADNNEDLEDN